MIVAMASRADAARCELALPSLLCLGTGSYSFHLWHPAVLPAVKRERGIAALMTQAGLTAQTAQFCIGLLAVLNVAWASQRWIKVRLTCWLRSFGPRKPRGSVERALPESGAPAL